jgi:uncharacterized membrane protein YdbT with pleckstrin-like domain
MIPGLCQDLFDYGCAKCLGAEVDFKAQEAALDKFGDFIREHQAKLDRALKMDADRREEARNRALKAEADDAVEQQKRAEAEQKKFAPINKGLGCFLLAVEGLLVAVGIGMIILAVAVMRDTTEGSLGAGGTLVVLGVLVAGVGVFFLQKKLRA